MGTRANDIATLIKNGSQIDSDAIGTSAITAEKISPNAITASKLNIGQLGGRRNLIINGAMQVAQRGTSESGVTSGGYYTVDRMTLIGVIGTWTVSQDTDAPTEHGFSNSMKLACTATSSLGAGDGMIIKQYLEGQNLQHLKKGTSNAESLTASFWVKTNKTGTYVLELRDADNVRTISKTFTVDAAGTWEKKTLTFAGDTTGTLDNDNARSFDFNIWLAAGTDFTSGTLQTAWGTQIGANRAVGHTVNLADSTSNYFNITGIQLELGETATPFEHRSYGEELALCQRYYFKPNDAIVQDDGSVGYKSIIAATAYAFNSTFSFPVKMRAAPTTTELTAPTYESSSSLIYNTNADGYVTRVTVGNNSTYRAYNWLAEFDAEL